MKTVVQSGTRKFPLFIGFAPADAIARVAEAPSFRPEQPHEELASNVLRPPVKDWQRPLDSDRVATIRNFFDDTGELMPNPVLLSANGEPADEPNVSMETLGGTTPTNVYVIEVPDERPVGSKPLWILDGQHRISGLASSEQKENDLPVVLLLNDDGGASYQGSDFASLFAQVTTTAKKLDELHNAWLTFAYELGEYSNVQPDHVEHREAMETVCELCETAQLANGEPNPFHNAVRFNPERPSPRDATFSYGCGELKELIRRRYYADAGSPLNPKQLANQLGAALRDLRKLVPAPQDESVFFGEGDAAQVAMQDAFLIGVLAYIKENGAPDDWVSALRALDFHKTDWKFKSWVDTTGGKAGADSRNVAQRVFTAAFRDNELPEGTNLGDYLRGSRVQVQIRRSRLNAAGRPITGGREVMTVARGDEHVVRTGEHLHFRVDPAWKRTNIARLQVIDATSNVANPRSIPELTSAKGLVLDPNARNRELQVIVRMVTYGGRSSEGKLTIRW